MKKFVFSAAALTLTGTAVANDDWAQLDQDIQALSASVTGLEDGGMQIGGRIRTLYQTSSDVAVAPSGNDLGGFSVRNARLYATGTTAGDIGYRVEVDFGNGAAVLRLMRLMRMGRLINKLPKDAQPALEAKLAAVDNDAQVLPMPTDYVAL